MDKVGDSWDTPRMRWMLFFPSPATLATFEEMRCGIEFIEAKGLADETGHVEPWLVKEVAFARAEEMRTRRRLVDEGLGYVERPMTAEGDDLVILTGLTELGEKACAVLKQGLVFNVETEAEDIEQTLDYYLRCVRRTKRLSQDDIKAAKAITHPIREMILTEMTKWMMVARREFDDHGDWVVDPDVEAF